MAKILITGGTGFVGRWMKETMPYGVGCRFLDRKGYDFFWDVWETETWDCIIHLAPVAPDRVIELAKRDNARLLYCSSGIVYHPENDTEYRQNKIKWEQECIASGADVVIARLFAFYGAWLDDNKAITQFIRAAKKGEPLRIWGDGNTVRSYMSGRTMARWLWAILLRGQTGEAYDVGDDKPVTMLELARMVVKYYRPAPILIEGGVDAMPVYLPRDTAKTKALLK